MRAVLGQIGGREVDGDALGGKCQAHCRQRRLHAFAALAHRLVGQADNGKARQTRRDLALNFDTSGFQPQIGDCLD